MQKKTFRFPFFFFLLKIHQQVVARQLCNVLHRWETWLTGHIPSRHLRAHGPWPPGRGTEAPSRYVRPPDGGCRCPSFFFFFSRLVPGTRYWALDVEEVVQRCFYFGERRGQSRYSLRHKPDRRGCCTHANAPRFPRHTASFIVVTSSVSAHISSCSSRRLPWKPGAGIPTIPRLLKAPDLFRSLNNGTGS